jgi:hypothetical protein
MTRFPTRSHLVTEVRDQANAQVLKIIRQQFTEDQQHALDALLTVPEDKTISRLQWLKAPPPGHGQTFARLVGEDQNTSVTRRGSPESHRSPSQSRQAAGPTRTPEVQPPIARAEASERYALLACFLHEALRDLTDQAVEMQAQLESASEPLL